MMSAISKKRFDELRKQNDSVSQEMQQCVRQLHKDVCACKKELIQLQADISKMDLEVYGREM